MKERSIKKCLRRCKHIAAYFDQWEEVVQPIKNQNDFISDLKNKNQICYLTFLIGEEIRQMSKNIYPPIKEAYPYIDWDGWVKSRNRIAHENFQLNWKEVYDFVTKEVGSLKRQLPHFINYIQSQIVELKDD